MTTLYISLALILALVLVLPFLFKAVEERLEFFLLMAGLASVSAAGIWSRGLLLHALKAPLAISAAVLGFGLAFSLLRPRLGQALAAFAARHGSPALVFFLVAGLGLLSGLLTALVSALLLSEALGLMWLARQSKVRIAVLGCFSIGLGAALTPLGEPLATIVISRLQGGAEPVGFWYLARLLGAWVLPLVLLLAFAARRAAEPAQAAPVQGSAPAGNIAYRAFKVYVFVVGLELLGAGFNPATGDLLKSLPPWALYWVSLFSAVLDNASLAAAGVAPGMSQAQLKHFLLGLMVSGGMLVPGNFPNIVTAGRLDIGLKEWAAVGLPAGFALMALLFCALLLF